MRAHDRIGVPLAFCKQFRGSGRWLRKVPAICDYWVQSFLEVLDIVDTEHQWNKKTKSDIAVVLAARAGLELHRYLPVYGTNATWIWMMKTAFAVGNMQPEGLENMEAFQCRMMDLIQGWIEDGYTSREIYELVRGLG